MKKNTSFLFILICTTILLSSCARGLSERDKLLLELNEPEYLMAALWQQTSSEYRALCYQAFNVARDRIHLDLMKEWPKPRAVIIDLDETLVFNSPYNASGVMKEQNYPQEFYEWIASGKATLIPGAKEFLEYINKEGYEIFYVTNRRDESTDITLQQIIDLGVPQANSEHLLMRGTDHTKQGRRDKVAEEYVVILYIGDNCVDFLGDFYNASIEERKGVVVRNKEKWGRNFIILPNPMHGSWKKALYYGKGNLTDAEKLQLKIDLLETVDE
ncbi:MAG TPA: 5'-nucleotidase, lipoprotein e(P4) family [Candidatus Cloacimonetes bacterium]|nr:5'-nucleotidase, lipoprotein e(P4) family [Candidatus Cloacimonadota bacterium]HEX37562.1 5'-nucleotidase, lipoprotein e(P4) family [Candidatus Cloacimonadota bacterium]